jgi:short-subunit dehydrogenase
MKIVIWHIIFIIVIQDMYAQNKKEIALLQTDNVYALVAGGSKGIGFSVAEALAKRNYNLILVARNKDSLQGAKNKLELIYNIHVEIIALDLSEHTAPNQLLQFCLDRNIHLKMLCNVAGFGGEKDFLTLASDSLRYMIDLNLSSGIYFKCGKHGRLCTHTRKKLIRCY